jgi:uncharacterized iron-regulated membrane protein
MQPTFRQSMTQLHMLAGVVASALLFAMFWMGTLSVFDREIDRWMQPMTRLAAPATAPSLDRLAVPVLEKLPEGTTEAYVYTPSAREPTLRVGYDAGGAWTVRHFDPATGRELPAPQSLAGTGFIFPFHFSFHISWLDLGYWIAGFLAMAMLVLLVSGVVIHRKIFAEFFVFRPKKNPRRSTLDLHNITSLVGLPFHVMLPLTGLFIFFSVYLPWSVALPFGGKTEPLDAALYGIETTAPSGTPAPMTSLDAMVAEARARWQARHGEPVRPDIIHVAHWGDANAHVTVRHVFPARQVTMDREALTFAAASGAVVQDFSAKPVRTAHAWLSGLHFIQFDHWGLRWAYFLAGLSGCAMIATGLLFLLRAREGKAVPASASYRTMEAMTIGGVTGIIAATGAFFVANRVLPDGASLWGQERAALEVWVFWLVWLGAVIHAAIQRRAAWAQQCWAIAALALAAVVLNVLTTGDHVVAAAGKGLWAVAGMDLMLIVSAAIAAASARRLQGSADATPVSLPVPPTAVPAE